MPLFTELISRPATCLPDLCFCEVVDSQGILQDANTWSALAFVIVGLLVLASKYKQKEKESWQYAYSLLAIFVGLGTFYYHSSLNFLGQTIDVFGMYLLVSFAFIFSLQRQVNLSKVYTAGLYVLLNSALLYVLLGHPEARRFAFALLVLGYIAFEIYLYKVKSTYSLRFFWHAFLSLTLGYAVWLLDFYGIYCLPKSLLQGHALWHILTALSAWFLFKHLSFNQQKSLSL